MDNMEIQEVREFFFNMVKDLKENFPETFECEDSGGFSSSAYNWLNHVYDFRVESGCEKTVFVPNYDFGYVLKFNPRNAYPSCVDEVILYDKAAQNRVEFCFAAAYKGFKFDGIDFTIMEYARPDEDGVYILSEPPEGYDEDGEDLREDCEIAWDAFINFWGVDDMSEAETFIDEWNIGDLHSANCGWTSDGKLKFFDYCGYLTKREEFHRGIA